MGESDVQPTLLRSVSDIGPDQIYKDLEQLAYSFGLMNMTQVCLEASSLSGVNGHVVAVQVTDENYYEAMRAMISVDVLAYACFEHDQFLVPNEGDEVITLWRTAPPEKHKASADNLYQQIKKVFETRGNPY